MSSEKMKEEISTTSRKSIPALEALSPICDLDTAEERKTFLDEWVKNWVNKTGAIARTDKLTILKDAEKKKFRAISANALGQILCDKYMEIEFKPLLSGGYECKASVVVLRGLPESKIIIPN